MDLRFGVGGLIGLKAIETEAVPAIYPFLVPQIFDGAVLDVARMKVVLSHIFREYKAANNEDLDHLIRQMERSCLNKDVWPNGCLGNEGLERIDFSSAKEASLLLGFAEAEFRMRRLGCCLAFFPRTLSSNMTSGMRLQRAVEAVMKSETSPIIPFCETVSVSHRLCCLNGGGCADLAAEIRKMRHYSNDIEWEPRAGMAEIIVRQFCDEVYREDYRIAFFHGLPIYARLKYIGNDAQMAERGERNKRVVFVKDDIISIEGGDRDNYLMEYFVRVHIDLTPVFLDSVPVEVIDSIRFSNEQILMRMAAAALSDAMSQIRLARFLSDNREVVRLGYSVTG